MRLVVRGPCPPLSILKLLIAGACTRPCAKPSPFRASDGPAVAGYRNGSQSGSRSPAPAASRSRQLTPSECRDGAWPSRRAPGSRGHRHACTRWSSPANPSHQQIIAPRALTTGIELPAIQANGQRAAPHISIRSPPPSSSWPQTQSSQENHVPRPPNGDPCRTKSSWLPTPARGGTTIVLTTPAAQTAPPLSYLHPVQKPRFLKPSAGSFPAPSHRQVP